MMASSRRTNHISIFLVTCLLVITGAKAQQTFDIRPSDTTTFVGATVTLECASSDKTGILMWIKSGRMVSQDTVVTLNADRYSITGDQSVGEYFLTITDVEVADAGSFFCILGQGGGNSATASPGAQLTVDTTTPPQQSFQTTPVDTTAKEGDTVVLECAVNDKVGDLAWLKTGVGQITSETLVNDPSLATRYSIVGDQSAGVYNLQITAAVPDDSGTYTCFVSEQGSITSIASDEAELTVSPAATTKPATTKQATTIRRITTVARTTKSEITVQPTTQEQRQTTSESTTEGLVTVVSQAPLCEISTQKLFYGDSVVLSCISSGGNSDVNLQFSKDGVDVEPSYVNTDEERRIHLSLVLSADLQGALYTCTSTHPSYTQALTCQFPPFDIKMNELTVQINPDVLIANTGEDGSFECEAETEHQITGYMWYFDDQEIDSADDRFRVNGSQLYLPNVTKAMDESEVKCTVTTANFTESATATIGIIDPGNDSSTSSDSMSLVIVISIVIVVLVVIIVSLVLFYCLWWKKRKEKEPQPDEQIIEEDTAEVAQSPVGSGNPAVAPLQNGLSNNGYANQGYHVEQEIPYGKANLLPPVRSHTPVGARPGTADIELRRDQPMHSSTRRRRKHKKKKKRHNIIGPQELQEINARKYGDKPRVLDHFVVDSVEDVRDNRHEEKERSISDGGSVGQNQDYEVPAETPKSTDKKPTPRPTPSKSPSRSRREFDPAPEEDGERPRSPTPESYRPRKSSERKHRRRRSLDDETAGSREATPRERRPHRTSSERRHRDSSERRHRSRSRRSRDDAEEGERRERRHRPRSSHHRNRLAESAPARPDHSEDSDVGLRHPKNLPPISSSLDRHQLEMKLRKTEESDVATTEVDDEREERRSRRGHRERREKSRDKHRHSRSRDRERSPRDE
ncbi:kin of IRRE-like protein 3 isoform X2 [Ptychodera flava]|uniref:kin of IRRE-like protein 3 isoform X2 n=1 Tax=Ptychodera flava TaxID=63121 RepID=UPI00396A6F52